MKCSTPVKTFFKDKAAFLANVSKFLILFRKVPPIRNDYAWHKLEEFHRELAVFSLMILAVHKWYGKETVFARLLALNLMDSYRESDIFDSNRYIRYSLKNAGG